MSGISPGDNYRTETKRVARPLVEGGSLTKASALLRRHARAMLATTLSCRVDASGSGLMARHTGAIIGADAWLPNMTTEEFLGCLSKAALNEAARANDVARFERTKDTRAALCRAFKERAYVYPAARFALTPEELEAERRSLVGAGPVRPGARGGSRWRRCRWRGPGCGDSR